MPRPDLSSILLPDLPSPFLTPGHAEDGKPRPALPDTAGPHRQVSRQGKDALRPGRCFSVHDYLALSSHAALRGASIPALAGQRANLPGSGPGPETRGPLLALESRTAAFLKLPVAAAFASGSAAIQAGIRAVLEPGDDVIADAGACLAMLETVLTCEAHLHWSPPGSVEAVERRLRRLSATPRTGQLWVAVPAISASASIMADLAGLSALCRQHDARLIVDVTHDLGSMAPGGGGVMELQGLEGRADLVVGSFAACFGVPGGFAALRDADRIAALRRAQSQAAGLSCGEAAKLLAGFDLVDSGEGARRRRRLHGNSLRLRNHLMADGLRVMGQPSAIVPVRLPFDTAQARTALVESAGVSVSLLTAPAVAAHAPRWHLILNAGHGPADIDDLADLIRDVTLGFDRKRRRPTP